MKAFAIKKYHLIQGEIAEVSLGNASLVMNQTNADFYFAEDVDKLLEKMMDGPYAHEIDVMKKKIDNGDF